MKATELPIASWSLTLFYELKDILPYIPSPLHCRLILTVFLLPFAAALIDTCGMETVLLFFSHGTLNADVACPYSIARPTTGVGVSQEIARGLKSSKWRS